MIVFDLFFRHIQINDIRHIYGRVVYRLLLAALCTLSTMLVLALDNLINSVAKDMIKLQ